LQRPMASPRSPNNPYARTGRNETTVSDQDPFKMSCKFTTEIKDYDTISIREQVNGMIGKFAETIIHTREHAVRDALGKLGWMAPEQVAALTSERDQLRSERDSAGLGEHNALAKVAELQAVVRPLCNLVKRHAPQREHGHICGPESCCDSECEGIYRIGMLLDRAAALAAQSAPDKPSDCTGDPKECPNNEGHGCHCGTGSAQSANGKGGGK
jgi:hypothetical protein